MSIMEQRLDLGCELADVWEQARANHEAYSYMGDDESDIRFLALGLAGEAGELVNFIKKRWRDGDKHEAESIAEIADVCAYAFMLAQKFGLTPRGLVREIARKQQVFIEKMKAKAADAQPLADSSQ